MVPRQGSKVKSCQEAGGSPLLRVCSNFLPVPSQQARNPLLTLIHSVLSYGNSETLAFDRLRPLDAKFKSLPPQAKEAQLSFVTLLGPETEYGAEAVDLFRHLCEGRSLVANIDKKDASSVSLTLFDANVNLAQTSVDSINVDLVRNGLARIDRRSPLRSAYPNVVKALDEAQREAKRNRAGAYELGDIFDDE